MSKQHRPEGKSNLKPGAQTDLSPDLTRFGEQELIRNWGKLEQLAPQSEKKLAKLILNPKANLVTKKSALIALIFVGSDHELLSNCLHSLVKSEDEITKSTAFKVIPVVWNRFTESSKQKFKEAFASSLQTEKIDERLEVLRLFVSVPDLSSNEEVIRLTRDKNLSIRVAAINALVAQNSSNAWKEIASFASDDPNWQVRHAALQGLAKNSDLEALKILEICAAKEELWLNQILIAQVLADGFGSRGLRAIAQVIFNTHADFRRQSINAVLDSGTVSAALLSESILEYAREQNITEKDQYESAAHLTLIEILEACTEGGKNSRKVFDYLASIYTEKLLAASTAQERAKYLDKLIANPSQTAANSLLEFCESRLNEIDERANCDFIQKDYPELDKSLSSLRGRLDPMIAERLAPYLKSIQAPGITRVIGITVLCNLQGIELNDAQVQLIEEILLARNYESNQSLNDLRLKAEHAQAIKAAMQNFDCADSVIVTATVRVLAAVEPEWLRAGVATKTLYHENHSAVSEALHLFSDNPGRVVEGWYLEHYFNPKKSALVQNVHGRIELAQRLASVNLSDYSYAAFRTLFQLSYEKNELAEDMITAMEGRALTKNVFEILAPIVNDKGVKPSLRQKAMFVLDQASQVRRRTLSASELTLKDDSKLGIEDFMLKLILEEQDDTIRQHATNILALNCSDYRIVQKMRDALENADEMTIVYAIRFYCQLYQAPDDTSASSYIDYVKYIFDKFPSVNMRREMLRSLERCAEHELVAFAELIIANQQQKELREPLFEVIKRHMHSPFSDRKSDLTNLNVAVIGEVANRFVVWLADRILSKDVQLRDLSLEVLNEFFDRCLALDQR